jgi:hypothetical protein
MMIKSYLVVLALITCSASSQADITLTGGMTPDIIIPDGDLAGIAETISLGSSIQSITDVQLTLDIGGASDDQPFNGDYYAYLTHGTGFAVLLNRVGVTAANPYGYADAGFDVTFSDSGPDIHNYQNDGPNFNGDGQLTGIWGPDGRTTSPLSVLDADPRSAFLSSFDGESSSGAWTLFIADCDPGDFGNLDSWTLDVSGTGATQSVPDSGGAGALLFLSGLSLVLFANRSVRPLS